MLQQLRTRLRRPESRTAKTFWQAGTALILLTLAPAPLETSPSVATTPWTAIQRLEIGILA